MREMAAEISQAVPTMCKKATAANALNEKRFTGLTRHKISYRAQERAWLQVEDCSYFQRGNGTGRG